MEHPITIGIEAESQQQAIVIASALVDIKNALSITDLTELASILKKNPGIVKTAKQFLG